jgi:tetratricopeptide (TPR) repeat protein
MRSACPQMERPRYLIRLNIIDDGGMMRRIVTIGLLSILTVLLISGCIPKELRTVKIEMGTLERPKQSPDLDRVKRNLDAAVKNYPNNAEVYHYVGRVAALEGRYTDMAAALAKSDLLDPKMKPQNDKIRQGKWKELFDQGKNKATSKELEPALESFTNSGICWPERYESWINAAVVAIQLNRPKDAYTFSSKAYAIAPDTIIVAENHAKMCVADSQFTEAKTVYQKVLAKNPTSVDILLELGGLCRTMDDTANAISYYNRALDIDKNNTAVWFDLGILYFQVKDFCRGSECFKHVIDATPEDKDANYNYILALMSCAVADTSASYAAKSKGLFETAKTELEKFTAAYPNNCAAWKLLSTAYIRVGMEKEAGQAYKKSEECEKSK